MSIRQRHASRTASISGSPLSRAVSTGFNNDDGSHAAMWSSLLGSFQDEFLSLKIKSLLDRKDAESRAQELAAEQSQPGTARTRSGGLDTAEFRLLSESQKSARMGDRRQSEGLEEQDEQQAQIERTRIRNLSAMSGLRDLDESLRHRNIIVKRGWLRDFMVELARARKLPPFTLQDALVNANGSEDIVVEERDIVKSLTSLPERTQARLQTMIQVTEKATSVVSSAVDSDDFYKASHMQSIFYAKSQPTRLAREHSQMAEEHAKAQAAGQAFLITQMDRMIGAAITIQRAFRRFRMRCMETDTWPSKFRKPRGIQPRYLGYQRRSGVEVEPEPPPPPPPPKKRDWWDDLKFRTLLLGRQFLESEQKKQQDWEAEHQNAGEMLEKREAVVEDGDVPLGMTREGLELSMARSPLEKARIVAKSIVAAGKLVRERDESEGGVTPLLKRQDTTSKNMLSHLMFRGGLDMLREVHEAEEGEEGIQSFVRNQVERINGKLGPESSFASSDGYTTPVAPSTPALGGAPNQQGRDTKPSRSASPNRAPSPPPHRTSSPGKPPPPTAPTAPNHRRPGGAPPLPRPRGPSASSTREKRASSDSTRASGDGGGEPQQPTVAPAFVPAPPPLGEEGSEGQLTLERPVPTRSPRRLGSGTPSQGGQGGQAVSLGPYGTRSAGAATGVGALSFNQTGRDSAELGPDDRDYDARPPTLHVPTPGFSAAPRFPDQRHMSPLPRPRTSGDGSARRPRTSSDGLRPLSQGGAGGFGPRGRAVRASISGGGDLPSSVRMSGSGLGPRGATQLARQYQSLMQHRGGAREKAAFGSGVARMSPFSPLPLRSGPVHRPSDPGTSSPSSYTPRMRGAPTGPTASRYGGYNARGGARRGAVGPTAVKQQPVVEVSPWAQDLEDDAEDGNQLKEDHLLVLIRDSGLAGVLAHAAKAARESQLQQEKQQGAVEGDARVAPRQQQGASAASQAVSGVQNSFIKSHAEGATATSGVADTEANAPVSAIAAGGAAAGAAAAAAAGGTLQPAAAAAAAAAAATAAHTGLSSTAGVSSHSSPPGSLTLPGVSGASAPSVVCPSTPPAEEKQGPAGTAGASGAVRAGAGGEGPAGSPSVPGPSQPGAGPSSPGEASPAPAPAGGAIGHGSGSGAGGGAGVDTNGGAGGAAGSVEGAGAAQEPEMSDEELLTVVRESGLLAILRNGGLNLATLQNREPGAPDLAQTIQDKGLLHLLRESGAVSEDSDVVTLLTRHIVRAEVQPMEMAAAAEAQAKAKAQAQAEERALREGAGRWGQYGDTFQLLQQPRWRMPAASASGIPPPSFAPVPSPPPVPRPVATLAPTPPPAVAEAPRAASPAPASPRVARVASLSSPLALERSSSHPEQASEELAVGRPSPTAASQSDLQEALEAAQSDLALQEQQQAQELESPQPQQEQQGPPAPRPPGMRLRQNTSDGESGDDEEDIVAPSFPPAPALAPTPHFAPEIVATPGLPPRARSPSPAPTPSPAPAPLPLPAPAITRAPAPVPAPAAYAPPPTLVMVSGPLGVGSARSTSPTHRQQLQQQQQRASTGSAFPPHSNHSMRAQPDSLQPLTGTALTVPAPVIARHASPARGSVSASPSRFAASTSGQVQQPQQPQHTARAQPVMDLFPFHENRTPTKQRFQALQQLPQQQQQQPQHYEAGPGSRPGSVGGMVAPEDMPLMRHRSSAAGMPQQYLLNPHQQLQQQQQQQQSPTTLPQQQQPAGGPEAWDQQEQQQQQQAGQVSPGGPVGPWDRSSAQTPTTSSSRPRGSRLVAGPPQAAKDFWLQSPLAAPRPDSSPAGSLGPGVKPPSLLHRRAHMPQYRASLSGPPVATLMSGETTSADMQEAARAGGGTGAGAGGGGGGLAVSVGAQGVGEEHRAKSVQGARGVRASLSVSGVAGGPLASHVLQSPTGLGPGSVTSPNGTSAWGAPSGGAGNSASPNAGAGSGAGAVAAASPTSGTGGGAGQGQGHASVSWAVSSVGAAGSTTRWASGEAPQSLMKARRMNSLESGVLGSSVGPGGVGPGAPEGGGRAAAGARGMSPATGAVRASTGALPQLLAAAAQQHVSTLSGGAPGSASLRTSGGTVLETGGTSGLYSMRITKSLNGGEQTNRHGDAAGGEAPSGPVGGTLLYSSQGGGSALNANAPISWLDKAKASIGLRLASNLGRGSSVNGAAGMGGVGGAGAVAGLSAGMRMAGSLSNSPNKGPNSTGAMEERLGSTLPANALRHAIVWEGGVLRQAPGFLVEGSGGSATNGPASSPASFHLAPAAHQAMAKSLALKPTLGRAVE